MFMRCTAMFAKYLLINFGIQPTNDFNNFSNTPLTTATDTANNDGAGLHCQLGLVAQYNWRTTAQAVFLCVPYGFVFLMGCMGRRSRLPVPVTGRPTLYSLSPNAWSLLVMDLIPITGASTMTTPTQNPSSVSQTLAAVICILQNLNPDTYTHTSTLLANASQLSKFS